jgi:hypothetical protein
METLYARNYSTRDRLPSNSIRSIFKDFRRQLWIGTDAGVCLFDGKNFRVYNTSHGLAGDWVWAIAEDGHGNMWFGTYDGGLSKFDNHTFTNYDQANGLYDQRIRVFQHVLEGFHRDWASLSKERLAVYSNLPPGTFTLLIKGQNLNSGQEFIQTEFSSTIHRTWFRTWWFFTLLGLVALAMVLTFHYYRIRAIRRREEERARLYRKLAEIEMQALQAQMNPHFVFNAMNAIQNDILGNKVDAALRNLADFARIIRLTLDNASRKYITLSEEMDYIRAYLDLEEMRFGDKFTDEIRMDKNVDDSLVMIPPMILQPYIENAVRHGLRNKAGRGRLLIECRITGDERLQFVIEDDGVGREPASRYSSLQGSVHRSHGTRISEERLALLNDDPANPSYYSQITNLFNDDSQPAGTRVEIWLPVNFMLTIYNQIQEPL